MADIADTKVKMPNLKKLPPWLIVAVAGGGVILLFIILRNNAAGSSNGAAPVSGVGDFSSLGTSFDSTYNSLTESITKIQSDVSSQLDKLTAQEQADIVALQDKLTVGLKGVTDSLTALTQRVTTSEGLIKTLQSQFTSVQNVVNGITGQLKTLTTQGAANAANITLIYQALGDQIQKLQAQITAMQTNQNPGIVAASVAAAFQEARSQLAHADRGNSYLLSFWYTASADRIIQRLKEDASLMPGSPIRAFLLSLVKSGNEWTIAKTPVAPTIGPIPTLPPFAQPIPPPAP